MQNMLIGGAPAMPPQPQQGGMEGPQMAAGPLGGSAGPMPPQGAPMGSQGLPEGAGSQQFTPEQIGQAHAQYEVMKRVLGELAAKPPGSLSKRDLFNAAAEMIAGGAFSTPDAKRQLVAQLTEMPDDESSLRKILGERLMMLHMAHQSVREAYPAAPNGAPADA